MRVVATMLSFCIVLPASAALLVSTPAEVCSLLNDQGLATRGWKNSDGLGFFCSSPYKEFGPGFPLANNLAFYAEGTRNAVGKVKLVLNVNNRDSSSAAHEELLQAANALSLEVMGEQLPNVLKDAIKNGSNASQKIGSSVVDVVKENWPADKGYEVKVIIK